MALYRPVTRKGEKSPFWHYDFLLKGRRYRGSTEEKNKVKAREKESDKRKEARSGGLCREVKPISFADFAGEYRKLHGQTKRSASFYEFTVRVLERHFGNRPLSMITPLDCAQFMAQRRKAVAPSTGNASLVILKHMFRMAEEWGYLAEGATPARKLKKEKVRNSRERYLKPEEARRLLEACPGWLRLIVLAAIQTGGRRAELLRLEWDAVDFRSGVIRFTDTKNGDSRAVPVGSILGTELRRLPNRIRGGRVFQRGGKPVTNQVLRSAFLTAIKRVGLEGFHFHDLRHTWATQAVHDGLSLRALQELGGWRRIEMVQRYAGVTAQSRERAAGVLERMLASHITEDTENENSGPTPTTAPPQARSEIRGNVG